MEKKGIMISIVKKYGQRFGLILVSALLVAHGGGLPSESEYQCDDYLWIDSNSTCTTGSAISQLQGKTKIDGNLVIYGAMPADLSALSELQTVGRDLVIRTTTGLVHLHGLEKLRNIGGKVVIESNYDLKSLAGLSVPEQLKGLTVQMNGPLQDLKGLENLKIVDGDLVVSKNLSVPAITDLKKLKSVTGGISLNNLSEQVDLYELRNIKTLNGELNINTLPKLVSLKGLEALTEVTKAVTISHTTITDTYALNALTKANKILINNNAELLTISLNNNLALHSFDSDINASQLLIQINKKLSLIEGAINLTKFDVLKIEDSPALTHISGFYNLSDVHHISLQELDLPDLAILNQLTSNWFMRIAHFPKLTHLPEMPLLSDWGSVYLEYLPELVDLGSVSAKKDLSSLTLDHLDKLTNLSTAASMTIRSLTANSNAELTSLSGPSFDNAESRIYEVLLDGNAKLTDIGALSNIKQIDRLTISNNPLLSALPLTQLSRVQNFTITNNGSLCGSKVNALLLQVLPVLGATLNALTIGNKACEII